MKVLFYSTQNFENEFIHLANKDKHEIFFVKKQLDKVTAHLAAGSDAVALFTIDDCSAEVLNVLSAVGVKYITLRSVGFDHVDLKRARELKIKVANVPEYSPHAIAEHTVALLMALNRKLIIADKQIHKYNFTLDNLIGFDLNGKTVGIIGTGKIGSVSAKILHGFGCKLIAFDIQSNENLKKQYNLEYLSLNDLCRQSDIIILNCSLNEHTRHMINKQNIAMMKKGVILINTARGAVINTNDVIEGLKSKTIGALGIDVYEKEKGMFYNDRSKYPMSDPALAELLGMENVIITGHQAFLTKEALEAIENTTINNLDRWEKGEIANNELNK